VKRNPLLMIAFGTLVLSTSGALAQNANGAGRSAGPAFGQAAGPTAGKANQHFLIEAMNGDIAEISMAKLAQENGSSDGVRQFGNMLERDHGRHLSQIQEMARQIGIAPPSEPPAKVRIMHDRLAAMSGAKFDKKFALVMVKEHKKAIAKYNNLAMKNGPLADFARQTLPMLEEHLQMARSLAATEHSVH
jgi:putative membrane protein